MLLITLLILVCTSNSFGAFSGNSGDIQSIAVRGTLTCNGRPESSVLLKLYDEDTGFDIDDFIAESRTNSLGFFEFGGYISEINQIDPKLNIYHDCNDGLMPCQRKISFIIPNEYVSKGKEPHAVYDVGTIELSRKYGGEERDCFH
ncbi:hypothetical protein AB6A40_003885 [Gnathostoma spinigerum]|uniref:Uncharacterized protein n=1 Tax=Gnathostoma spinigerum TaxID=75299 RepID=A0ABD6EDA0_9BILA